MSNRKKTRMDAIERRLAELETHALPDGAYLRARGWKRVPPIVDGEDGFWWGVTSPDGRKVESVERHAVKQQREWDAEADPPEFSCQPTVGEILPDALATGQCGKYTVEDRGTWPLDPDPAELRYQQAIVAEVEREAADPAWRIPAADVRERASERSNLTDASIAEAEARINDAPLWGGSEHFQSLVTLHCAAHKTLDRYEASLHALIELTEPAPNEWRALDQLAEVNSLIRGCLEGGTITPEGLQRAE